MGNYKIKMSSNYDNRAGGDTIPPPKRVNSLQSIMKLRPIQGAEWSTIAFVLNRDMIKPDGSLDELHAVVFPLGSFHNQSEAEEHAKNVISITGHPGVIAARYGSPFPLTTRFNPDNVVEVTLDTKGRIIELESAQYKREKEDYERRLKIERDIMKEAEEEGNPDSIEHFKRQCYLAIKNRSSYQIHTREADAAWQNYKKRETAVREHYARHPEHEAQWLSYLKEKLSERGELELYCGIEIAYGELRDELLGLTLSSDEEDKPTNSTNDGESLLCKLNEEDDDIICLQVCDDDNIISSQQCDKGVCKLSGDDDNIISSQQCDNGFCELSGEDSDIICLQECDNGVCKLSDEDNDIICSQYCDNGVCKTSDDEEDIIPASDILPEIIETSMN